MRNPLERERRLCRAALLAGLIATGVSAAWAFWPLPKMDAVATVPDAAQVGAESAVAKPVDPLNADAFRRAVLWPILAEPEPEAPPAEPPITLRLLGIARTGDALHATLYDATNDRIVTVAPEEQIGDFRVTCITATEVVFQRGEQSGSMRLENGPRSLQGRTP